MQDPVLCLTASVTLRDKPMSATAQRQELIELFKSSGGVYKVVQAKSNGSVPPKDRDEDEDDVLYGLEEVNLLEGLTEGTHYSDRQLLELLISELSWSRDYVRPRGAGREIVPLDLSNGLRHPQTRFLSYSYPSTHGGYISCNCGHHNSDASVHKTLANFTKSFS